MSISYQVPENKRLRIIIDTDAACEADDPYAISHALMCKKFEVKAIFAEHFVEDGSMEKSYEEICAILEAMEIKVPVFRGELGKISSLANSQVSEASDYLIKEAMIEDEKPLYVLCIGAITNIATAIRKEPEIVKKMTVIWIGGQKPGLLETDNREYNSGNDIDAINEVISSNVEFWQIPNNVYGSMHIGIAEIERRIRPCGKIGKHLYDLLNEYNQSEKACWTAGESWSLGDSPAIGVALEPNCGEYTYQEAPIFNEDTSYRYESGRPKIRIYNSINSRFIIEDFISKLELEYGSCFNS
ncbi:MAG: nucleoside hydrolase [Spirochaetales bacterium]|nr:nucleoside hydrolase [Spirochaetales bacterium]